MCFCFVIDLLLLLLLLVFLVFFGGGGGGGRGGGGHVFSYRAENKLKPNVSSGEQFS